MIELFNQIIYTFGTSSGLKVQVKYEHKRSNNNMLYRFYYKIFISDRNGNPNPYGNYQNNLRASFNLNGTNVWNINTQSASSGWSYEYTSDWLTVQNKATGTVPFNFTIKDTQNTGWCNYTSSNFNLIVDPGASVLKNISNFNIGQPFYVDSNKYANLYDVLTIKLGTRTIKTINNVSNSNLIDFTSSELSTIYGLLPTSQNGTFTFELRTYSDSSKGTQIGNTSTDTAIGYIVSSNPVINSKSAIDIRAETIALTGSNTKMVKYESTIKITVSATTQNQGGSPTIYVNNILASNGVVEIEKCSTNLFNIVVNDARGFKTEDNITISNIINYIPLKLGQTIKRNQPTDGKVKIKYDGEFFNNSFGAVNNTLNVKYRYRNVTDNGSFTDWINLSPIISNNKYSQELITEAIFDYKKQYEFELQSEDELQIRLIKEIPITKGSTIFNWDDTKFEITEKLVLNKVDLEIEVVSEW